jgi:hypothetical protein
MEEEGRGSVRCGGRLTSNRMLMYNLKYHAKHPFKGVRHCYDRRGSARPRDIGENSGWLICLLNVI